MAFTIRAEAIIPKGFDVGKLRAEIESALVDEGERDAKTLRKTTTGWSSAPPIEYKIGFESQSVWVWIGPGGSQDLVEKWQRIDEGTEERGWTSANTMVFLWKGFRQSYIPKTRPGQFSSDPGGGTKLGTTRRTKTIKRHSIDARNWSQMLGIMRIKPFAESVQAAIARGLA